MPQPRTPQLVIFDCDGVLVDTERIAVRIDAELISELGWEITEAEVVERFLGRTEADCIAEIEAHVGHALPPGVSFESAERYRIAFERDLEPVEGVVATLDSLEGAGVATCVASSGSHEKMRFTLGLTGLFTRFEGRIYSAEEVAHGKPAPDLFLHAARSMAVEPARSVVIEDSAYGLQAAAAAGMRGYGFGGGLTPRAKLEAAGGIVFEHMSELPGLLDI